MKKIHAISFLVVACTLSVSAQNGFGLLWTKQLGGTGTDYGSVIKADNAGNVYVAGAFSSMSTFGTNTFFSRGGLDIFITKFDANGSLLWAQQAGGQHDDHCPAMAIDGDGNILLAGDFYDVATFGTNELTSSGGFDVFLTKMDANGNVLWSLRGGGTDRDSAKTLCVDSSQNIYVAGDFQGTAAFGTNLLMSQGGRDVFVAKLNSDGKFLWAKQGGGTNEDYAWASCTDFQSNLYVAGRFVGNATFGSDILMSRGKYDIFLAKLDTNGNFHWVKQEGGPEDDQAWALGADGSGKIYLAGDFVNSATFGTNVLTAGGPDAYLAKYDLDGNLNWVKGIGGDQIDEGYALQIDGIGNAYVAGAFSGTVNFGTNVLVSDTDAFITKLDNDGNMKWAFQLGGTMSASGSSVCVDRSGNVFMTGYCNGTNTPINFDIFIARFGEPPPAIRTSCVGNSLVLYWPTNNASGFSLVSGTDLTNTMSWTAVSAPVTPSNEEYFVTVPLTNIQQFFRLKK